MRLQISSRIAIYALLHLAAAPERQMAVADPGEDTATNLRIRDELDEAQSRMAPDAELIDTTDLTLEAVVTRIEGLVAARTS